MVVRVVCQSPIRSLIFFIPPSLPLSLPQRSIRLTALQWVHSFIVYLAHEKLIPFYADLLGKGGREGGREGGRACF